MTIYEFDRYINGKLMAEGVTIEKAKSLGEATVAAARIASKGPKGEAPVLVLRREPAALEAPPAQEPVAQCCMCGKGGVSTAEDGTPGCELPDGRWVCSGECWDRAASWPVPDPTQPDALALVAAAHHDAAERIGGCMWGDYWNCDGILVEPATLSKDILSRTPADAEAHLTAIERAAYERGVQDAVQVIDERLEGVSTYGEWAQGWIASLNGARGGILALLTQEGR